MSGCQKRTHESSWLVHADEPVETPAAPQPEISKPSLTTLFVRALPDKVSAFAVGWQRRMRTGNWRGLRAAILLGVLSTLVYIADYL